MKQTLLITTALIITALMLIVGCSSPEPINYETTLIERDGVHYTKDTNKPYSGPVFSLDKNGQKRSEGTLKDGKKDGEWTIWYKGQKWEEGSYKNGKFEGLWTGRVYPRGRFSGIFRDGEKDGKWTYWYDTDKLEVTFKDGRRMKETWWDENGNEINEPKWY